jgi:hypothetical protein
MSDYDYQTGNFFYYRSINYRTINLEKLSDYRLSDSGIQLSDSVFECLKVLSSEMDPAQITLIRLVVIKERGVVALQKIPPILHPVRAL